jgi:hypothetical protein
MSKENTFRALQDLPLIMGFMCRIGLHKWTVWDIGKRSSDSESTIQYRVCVHCNKMQSNQTAR